MPETPIPLQDPIARRRKRGLPPGKRDPYEGLLTEPWIKYFSDREITLAATPERIALIQLTSQGASIGATALPVGSLTTGLYRITYYARITQAAGTSSSLTVTFDWSDSSVVCTVSGAAMTGNTTTTVQTGTLLVIADAATPIRYSTTRVSAGSPVMQYKLSITAERVKA